MDSYEIRFFREGGSYSASCHSQFASDNHAMRGAQRLLDEVRPAAAVWQGERCVGKVCRIEPQGPLAA